MKYQLRITNLPSPLENTDAVCKSYVENDLNHPSTERDTANVDFNEKNLDKNPFVKINSFPAVRDSCHPNFMFMKLILVAWTNHHCLEKTLINI